MQISILMKSTGEATFNVFPALHRKEGLLNENNYKKYLRKIAVSIKSADKANFNVFQALCREDGLLNGNNYKKIQEISMIIKYADKTDF